MGMYDTFFFQHPIYCPRCGEKITKEQSKFAGCDLKEYRPGDKILSCKPNMIVFQELYCDHKGVYNHQSGLGRTKEPIFQNCKMIPLSVILLVEDSTFVGAFIQEREMESYMIYDRDEYYVDAC